MAGEWSDAERAGRLSARQSERALRGAAKRALSPTLEGSPLFAGKPLSQGRNPKPDPDNALAHSISAREAGRRRVVSRRLAVADRDALIALDAAQGLSQRAIAAKYGISKGAVAHILSR